MTALIRAPFFEIGPKTFLDRTALLEVADAAWEASVRYDVDVIVTPPALDIEAVKQAAPGLRVFAQAMDAATAGPSTGAIVAEALAAVGADGVMLNHAERPLDDAAIVAAIGRARDARLLTMVCAPDVDHARRCAALGPDIVLLEPPDLIGESDVGERPWVEQANATVADTDPGVLVMHSGGVADERDVRNLMALGAAGTGCTTAIVRAPDRRDAIMRMVRAVREGWDARATLLSSAAFTIGSDGPRP